MRGFMGNCTRVHSLVRRPHFCPLPVRAGQPHGRRGSPGCIFPRLIHVLPHFMLMQPNRIRIIPDELVRVHRVNRGCLPATFCRQASACPLLGHKSIIPSPWSDQREWVARSGWKLGTESRPGRIGSSLDSVTLSMSGTASLGFKLLYRHRACPGGNAFEN